MAAAVEDIVVPVPVEDNNDEDVDRVVVVEAETEVPPLLADDDNEWFGPAAADPDGVGGAGTLPELDEFSSSSCCTCRMSTYSSRLAFGLVRVEIPAP